MVEVYNFFISLDFRGNNIGIILGDKERGEEFFYGSFLRYL